jgi:hypothetical protein
MFAYRSTRTTFSRNAGYCLFYSLHIDGFLCSGMSMLTQQVASRIETTKVIEQTGVQFENGGVCEMDTDIQNLTMVKREKADRETCIKVGNLFLSGL